MSNGCHNDLFEKHNEREDASIKPFGTLGEPEHWGQALPVRAQIDW